MKLVQKRKKARPRRKKTVEAVDPKDNLCPLCRKRGVLAVMEPMDISGMSTIKWKCPVCCRAYDAKLKERGTITPWEKR